MKVSLGEEHLGRDRDVDRQHGQEGSENYRKGHARPGKVGESGLQILAETGAVFLPLRSREGGEGEHGGGDQVGHGVEHEGGVDAHGRHQQASEGGTGRLRDAERAADEGVGPRQIPPTDHAREGGPDRGVEDRTGQAHKEDKYVDGGEIPGEDQPQNENRPRKVAGYEDDPAVDAIREDSGQRASDGGQQTGDERTANGRGATRDLDYQDHERDHGDRVAHERGSLADPEPQKASVA